MRKERFLELLKVVKYVIYGFLMALVLFSVLFLKTHWVGFMKFVSDPAFFDSVSIERDYQLKK